ncbi:MAG: adenylyl-sulfate kinase [Hyphomicrobiaceae bacterium]|nr:adenylyl-sulfate kinase [Hyphomicrobiaceae bacterium]
MQHTPLDPTRHLRETGPIGDGTPLRFIACGSADVGKSTLIARLLHDTRFATETRRLIAADMPGHARDTRNVVAGAATADLAVILVDARQGVVAQTRRHSRIAALLGIRHAVLAVNKIDLAGYDREVFQRIVEDYRAFAEPLAFASLLAIPISARCGDNVVTRSAEMGWYAGPVLLEYLESVEVANRALDQPFRMHVECADRPNRDSCGYSGTVASGRVRPGDRIVVASTGCESRVRSITARNGQLAEAAAGDAVTLMLTDEVDVSRGDLLAPPDKRPEVSDQFAAHVVWMHDEPLIPGRPYRLRIGTRTVAASITEIKHREDVDTLQKLAAKTLRLDEIGFVNVETHEPVAFDPYDANRETGAFVLLDRLSDVTVGAGMIRFGLRRATNVHWQALDVTKASRAGIKGQQPCCLWFTGLSGSGKSTIANLLERKLCAHGRHTFILDGDNTRHGLNRDLGFTDADRVENIRRAAHVARLMVDSGLIVLVSFISPFEAERRMARELFESGEFIEVFVDAPLEVCERRDVKGLYKKARAGQIQNFTGISSRYEPPGKPDLHLQAGTTPADALADSIYDHLRARSYF